MMKLKKIEYQKGRDQELKYMENGMIKLKEILDYKGGNMNLRLWRMNNKIKGDMVL